MSEAARPIGVFDSGVGGLSVLRALRAELPDENFIYVADQANVPYGRKSAEKVHTFSEAIVRWLLDQDVKLIVVACNTATAAALNQIRSDFPAMPFVGTEPAVKPGARATQSGHVGVLATARTFHSQRYARLMADYAQGITLHENACDGLVELIEAGAIESAETRALLTDVVTPMLAATVDTLVLGCTHYPFITSLLRDIVGPDVTIIDPAPAVARWTRVLLESAELRNHDGGQLVAVTSGEPETLRAQFEQLLGLQLSVRQL